MKKTLLPLLLTFCATVYAQDILMQNGTFNQCSGIFYDSGGAGGGPPGTAGNYANNESYTITICGDTPANYVVLQFTAFSTQVNVDTMSIYDGADTSAPFLGTYAGAVSPGIIEASDPSINPSGCITIVFNSNGTGDGPGWAANISCYEPCQEITAEIVGSTPAPNTDGEVEVCFGGDVIFEGGAQFSADDDTATSTYEWDFGNGTTGVGQTVTANYPEAGVYIVELTVTDDNPLGCSSTNTISQVVRVYPEIDFTGTQAAQDIICLGESTTIEGVATVPMFEDCAPEIIANAWLQDTETTGQPVSYASTITVDCYGTNQVLTDVSQLLNLCLNIEHSFVGDLDMYLIAPNGQEVWFTEYVGGGVGGSDFGISGPGEGVPGTGWTYCFSADATQTLLDASGGAVLPAGTYLPMAGSSFDNILGTPLNGDWTFVVVDLWAIDDGTLFWWNLNFDPSVTPPSNSIASEAWDADPSIIDTNGNIITVQPATSGVHCYTYRATDDLGCEYTEEVCITVEEELLGGVSATSNAICEGEDAVFNITGTPNATITYNLNGGADVQVQLDASGNYTITVPAPTADQTLNLTNVQTANSSGCNVDLTASTTVTVNQALDSSFSYTATCDGGVVNLTGDPGGVFSFNPSPTDGAVIDPATGTITNGSSEATYTVVYDFGNTCSTPTTQSVTVLEQDDSSFALTATCDGATAVITGDLGGSFAFSPDPMDGAVLDTNSGAITNGQPGATYTIEYTTTGLCFTGTSQSVTVFPLEDASFTLTANCTGATATVTGDANGTFALSPDPGDGAVIDPVTGTLSNAVSGATYTVSYTTSGPCPETTSQSVTVPNQDDATFTMTPNCSGATANISGTTGGTFAFNPVPNDGAVIDPVTGEITNAPSGATYTVEYTTVGTCADSSTVQVSVLITDDPSFVMSPTCDGATVASTATPGGTFSFDVPPTDTAVIDTGTGTISGGTPGATYSVGYVTNGTCPSSSVVQVTAHSLPVVVAPTDLIVCDDNVPDGVVELDLTVKDGEITGNNANYVVTYHPDQASADLGTPEVLPSADAYVGTDGEVVYVRVEHVSTGCYDTTTLTLQVVGAPAANAPAPLTYCDPDNDGLGTFDLASTVAGITGGDPALDVTFHLTQQNAEDDVLPQASPLSNVLGQVIFVRVDYANASTDCPTVLQLQLIVNPTPEIEESPSPLELCDEDGTSDGFTEFDLTASETEILNGLSAADYTVTYYVDPADAAVGPTASSYIAAPGAFTNTMPFQQTIGVRVEDNTTGCHSTALLDLEVHLLPEPVTTTEALQLNICDDSLDNDGYAVFDLTVQNGLITANESGLSVSYYETQLEAQDDQPIADPTAYANTSVNGQPHNPQTLYVRVTDNDTGCYDFSTLTLVVDPVPTPTPSDQLDALEQCDSATPGDMVELFDLTANETDILNGETGVTPTYHETLEDAEAGTPMIADPTAYANLSDTQTIYVRVTNDSTGCYTIVDFDIVVHPLPAVVAVTDYEVCEVQTDGVYGFDLESKTEEVLNGQDPNIFVVTYHDSQGDADLGTDDLISLYSNTSNPQTIYVRIENTLTGCSISTPTFEIQVFDGAEANADAVPIEYVQCDDNMETDGDPTNDSVQFDLATLDAEVLDGQDPAVFTVSYYATLADADAGTDQLPTLYENTVNPQTVYVRVDNDGTPDNFCYALSEVTLMVDPLPVFDLADSYVLCLDTNGTEVVGPTVLDTGLDTSGYSFEWTQDGTVLAGATEGSYEPTVGGIYGVTVTDLATGCSHMDSTVVEESTPPVLTAEVLTQAFADTHVVEAVATGSGVSTFEYSLDNGPWQESGTFVDVPAGEHTITARDVNGCGTATVTLMVMDYPVFFTPNGDGYHDTWNIYGISSQANAKIYIFDRYGKLLKQLSPTGDGWDGSYNGEPLPSSDYWFTVEYNEPGDTTGSRKEFKAHFTLKR